MSQKEKIEENIRYLEDGGMGEVTGLAMMSKDLGQAKVQMDTDMALALCVLAGESVTRRKAH